MMKKLRFLWPAAAFALVVGCNDSRTVGSTVSQGMMKNPPIANTKDPRGFDNATGGGPETTPGGEFDTRGNAVPASELPNPATAGGAGAAAKTPGAEAKDGSGGSDVAGGSNGPGTPPAGTTGTRGDIQGTTGERY